MKKYQLGKYRVIITADLKDEQSILKAEIAKTQCENNGYALKDYVVGFSQVTFTYEKPDIS